MAVMVRLETPTLSANSACVMALIARVINKILPALRPCHRGRGLGFVLGMGGGMGLDPRDVSGMGSQSGKVASVSGPSSSRIVFLRGSGFGSSAL